jgi:hypothetical protein
MKLIALKTFPSELIAESVAHTLDAWNIPFLIDSLDIGLFGLGSSGMPSTLMVREDDEADARIILKDLLD